MKRIKIALAQVKEAMNETEKSLDQYAQVHNARRKEKAQKRRKRWPFFRS